MYYLVQRSIIIYCDNISNIILVNNSFYHARTKHVEVYYHFLRDKVLVRDIDLVYVGTEDQLANIFAKALCRIFAHLEACSKCWRLI